MATDNGTHFRPLGASASVRDAFLELSSRENISGRPEITRLEGGFNNKVYKASCGGRDFLLKHYFTHPADRRDRLSREFRFLEFASAAAADYVPRPVAMSRSRRMALYEYIHGKKAGPRGATAEMVRQAIGFLKALNRGRSSAAASSLPPASEACFSVKSHLDCVSGRVLRLSAAHSDDSYARKAALFARSRLAPLWDELRSETLSAAKAAGIAASRPLGRGDRLISPSDFGFHNALALRSGRLKFIDFEYAGWDDPAKTVNDFFCQPAVPAPPDSYAEFLEAALAGLPDKKQHRLRIPILLPAYRVKWCCIILGCFLKAGAQRRSFSRDGLPAAHKAAQLEKAEKLLEDIRTGSGL